MNSLASRFVDQFLTGRCDHQDSGAFQCVSKEVHRPVRDDEGLDHRRNVPDFQAHQLSCESRKRTHLMLNSRRLLSAVSCFVLSIAVVDVVVNTPAEPSSDTLIASRYHLRQHASTSGGRSDFRSNRMSPTNHSYRQNIDRPSPTGPHYLRPQEKIATKPANGVQS